DVDGTDAGGGPDDRLILEVGGEQYPVRQILSTLFVAPPGEGLTALPLSPQAFRPGLGVPVIETRLGFPVKTPGAPAAFRGLKGVEFLVARSPIRVGANQDVTTNGSADRAEGPLEGGADWREGARVYGRVSAAALREGTRAIGRAEPPATMSTRHPRSIRSPGLDGAGLNGNSPSGPGGVLMNTLIGSGSRHSSMPYGVSASSRFIRQLRWSVRPNRCRYKAGLHAQKNRSWTPTSSRMISKTRARPSLTSRWPT